MIELDKIGAEFARECSNHQLKEMKKCLSKKWGKTERKGHMSKKRKARKARKARTQKMCPCSPTSAQMARKRAAKFCKKQSFKGKEKGAFMKCVASLVSAWKKEKAAAQAAKKALKRQSKNSAVDVDMSDLGWAG